MKPNLDILQTIEKVAPSPFLYERILKIIAFQKSRVSTSDVYFVALPSLLIVIITCFLFFQKPNNKHSDSLIKEMHLTESNSLY